MRKYYPSARAADIVDGNIRNRMDFAIGPTQGNITVNNTKTSTETTYWDTAQLHPGTKGNYTGDYDISVYVSTANSNISLVVQLDRINSTGTIQQSSSASAPQTLTAVGDYAYAFTSLSLGTFSSTDRLQVRLIATNASKAAQSWAYAVDNVLSHVEAPYPAKFAVTT